MTLTDLKRCVSKQRQGLNRSCELTLVNPPYGFRDDRNTKRPLATAGVFVCLNDPCKRELTQPAPIIRHPVWAGRENPGSGMNGIFAKPPPSGCPSDPPATRTAWQEGRESRIRKAARPCVVAWGRVPDGPDRRFRSAGYDLAFACCSETCWAAAARASCFCSGVASWGTSTLTLRDANSMPFSLNIARTL